ncbi:MAG: GTPase HflX, partial [Nitrospirae bacterium]
MGNLNGLKANHLARLTRLFRRRIAVDSVVSFEVARQCAELSHEIRRQIGLLINRRGDIEAVIVGTDRQLVIPPLSRSRSGPRLLRGVRLVHTHLHNQPLTKDDLVDLALLRLDLMVAIGVGSDGAPADVFVAYLLPPNPEGKTYEELPPSSIHALHLDCGAFVQALETELAKATAQVYTTEEHPTAIVVSVSTGPRREQEERVAECEELARSQGIRVLGSTLQRPNSINPKYVLGSGKIRDVIISALQCGAELLIFDQDLTPAQVRAISELTEMKVVDRTQLILDIFARRAHSRAGKIQVELAQLKYLLPRLAQSNTAFSRLGGGIGGRGPGETKLETDVRRVRDRIAHLERELQRLAKQRDQQRVLRVRHNIPIISIIGYTNAGKSTLFNALTHSSVSVRNRPFETLDTVSRRFFLPNGREAIMTDTVGFLRDLPQDLLKAFRTTLEELREADLLLHVVDVSAGEVDRQIQAVEQVLMGLHLETAPRLVVLNKCDRISQEEREQQCRRRQAIGISAIHPETLEPLRMAIGSALASMDARMLHQG